MARRCIFIECIVAFNDKAIVKWTRGRMPILSYRRLIVFCKSRIVDMEWSPILVAHIFVRMSSPYLQELFV